RAVRRGPIEARLDLSHQVLDELEVGGALAVGEPEVDEVRDERVGDLGRHAVGELVEGRAGRERLHEFLVVEDRLADLAEPLLREVEQAEAFEDLRVDSSRTPLRRTAGMWR